MAGDRRTSVGLSVKGGASFNHSTLPEEKKRVMFYKQLPKLNLSPILSHIRVQSTEVDENQAIKSV